LGIKEHCRFRKVQFVFVFWTEEVAAICHAVVVELAGRPTLGNDLRMIAIRNEFRESILLFLRGDRTERRRFVDEPKTKVDLQIPIVESAWTVYFADLRQHLTLSILAHFQNRDQQKTSNTDDERVSKFQLQRPSQICATSIFVVISLRFFVTHFRHFYTLPTSQRTPTARHTIRALAHTQASLLWPQPAGPPAQPGLRPVLATSLARSESCICC